jgi:uracil-DNA glycosylase
LLYLAYWIQLKNFLLDQPSFYPELNQVFYLFHLCQLQDVKVVILGQDPYHTPGAAHGLAFSVNDGIPIPPSLRNIFTEIKNDVSTLQLTEPKSGNLECWVKQGVFLLNRVLTVKSGTANSHANKGKYSVIIETILIGVRLGGIYF